MDLVWECFKWEVRRCVIPIEIERWLWRSRYYKKWVPGFDPTVRPGHLREPGEIWAKMLRSQRERLARKESREP